MASAIAIGSASMTPIFIAKVPQNLFSDSSRVSALGGLKALPVFSCTNTAWNLKTVTNGSRVQCMQVVNPLTNHRFETLSYLPPLTPEDIAKDVEYLLKKGWIPCLEFDAVGVLYRKHVNMCGYYDGRYWTMWKLPMFGCQDAAQVLTEIEECKKAYPNCYIRLLGFDNKRQVQCTGFVVHRPVDS